jgi:hypothetical protein
MSIVLNYDLSSNQKEVKAALEELGYSDYYYYNSNPTRYYVPHSSLFHRSKSPEAAISDLNGVCSALRIKPTRAIATKMDDHFAIPGQP